MKSKKAKLRIFILLLLAAVGTYALITFTGLLVEEETHVLVDEDLKSSVDKSEVNTEKLYLLRTKIEEQIEEDKNLIANRLQKSKADQKSDLDIKIEEILNDLNEAGENILDLDERELEKLHEKLKNKHQELKELLKNKK